MNLCNRTGRNWRFIKFQKYFVTGFTKFLNQNRFDIVKLIFLYTIL